MRALINIFRRRKEEAGDALARPVRRAGDFTPYSHTDAASSIPAENVIQFPAAIEFPEIAAAVPFEPPDAGETLIRRISWDERRFSQSMTEEV
jgi:hypothetical protein